MILILNCIYILNILCNAFPRPNHLYCVYIGYKKPCDGDSVGVSCFHSHVLMSFSHHMMSTKHGHKLKCNHSNVSRHKHSLQLQRWLFFSLLEGYFRSRQEPVSHSTPYPLNILTSSLSVVNADMLHLEALPYMWCIDISLLTFPVPGGLIVKLL